MTLQTSGRKNKIDKTEGAVRILHKKLCIIVTVIAFVIGIAGRAWGGVSLSAFPEPAFREYPRGTITGGRNMIQMASYM